MDDACGLMANLLGRLINDVVTDFGGPPAITTHEQFDGIMNALHSNITQLYTGWNGTIKTATGHVRPSTGGIERQPPIGGPSGFKEEYRYSKTPEEGKMHHFAACLSAGINGSWFKSFAHEYGTDYFGDDNNPHDRALGDIVYKFGASLEGVSYFVY